MGWVLLFDIQGCITLVLGGLLALITLFTFCSHVHLPFLGAVALDQQGLFDQSVYSSSLPWFRRLLATLN